MFNCCHYHSLLYYLCWSRCDELMQYCALLHPWTCTVIVFNESIIFTPVYIAQCSLSTHTLPPVGVRGHYEGFSSLDFALHPWLRRSNALLGVTGDQEWTPHTLTGAIICVWHIIIQYIHVVAFLCSDFAQFQFPCACLLPMDGQSPSRVGMFTFDFFFLPSSFFP